MTLYRTLTTRHRDVLRRVPAVEAEPLDPAVEAALQNLQEFLATVLGHLKKKD